MTAEITANAGKGGTQPRNAALYPNLARAVAGLLTATSRASPLAILFVLSTSEGPVNPLHLIRLFAAACALPGLAALAMRHVFHALLRVDSGMLLFEQPGRRIEIPAASIAAVELWRLPLPESGLHLRLKSGTRWGEGIAADNPSALIDELIAAGAPLEIGQVATTPSSTYALARATPRRSWLHTLCKFPVFALVATIPLFRVHQIIAYGGAFGEYYLHGPGAYLAGFAVYWATITIYLVLYAALLRAAVELATLVGAVAAPARASRVHRTMQRLAAVLYYAGAPAAVVLRFIPW